MARERQRGVEFVHFGGARKQRVLADGPGEVGVGQVAGQVGREVAGAGALTRTPRSPHWAASCRLRLTRVPLVAL